MMGGVIVGFANELSALGGGEIFLYTLSEDWSFGVVVREMLMVVNCVFKNSL